MFLNQLFYDEPFDFERRCRLRILLSMGFMVLGAAAIGLVFLTKGDLPILYMEPDSSEFVSGFYTGSGFGLLAAGLLSLIRNLRYLKNPDLKKRRKILETDERNRMMGLRCWAYSGYSLFALLYVGMLVGGFISKTILIVLLAVAGVYAGLLLLFKIMLQRTM